MRQAIQTRFVPPTNTKGARISARADAGRITLSWDHGLNAEGNHRAAAEALAARFGWKGRLIGGGLPDGSSVWVFEEEAPAAPKMLDALRGVTGCLAWHVEDQGRGVAMDAEYLRRARAIIAEAEGAR